jgi:sodium-dependent dicarboxylate transporter 2/3/5
MTDRPEPAGTPSPEDGVPPSPARQYAAIAGGAILFVVLLILPPPAEMPAPAWRVAACAALMAVWWLTEAVPVAATALVPLVLFPVLGVASVEDTAAPYANPLIFLFMGGFMIAMAMQRWSLHRRIALGVLRLAGSAPARLVGGFMIATAFLSMWVSNTATTVMMVPIALSVIGLIGDGGKEGAPPPKFAIALLLSIAYAASIGGMATLIGTPPNALLAAFLAEQHGYRIGFAQWMLLGVPLALVLLYLAWLLLTGWLFPCGDEPIGGAADAIDSEIAALGPVSTAEKRVAAVFALVALSWIGRPLLDGLAPGLSDAGIAVAGAMAMFVIPAGTGDGRLLLNWDWAKRLPWGVLILFGGGLTLAAGINDSGLAAWIGAAMKGFAVWPLLLVVAALTAVVIFLTELTSNTATAATFLPLTAALATAVGVSVPYLAVPAALAASCAFMMPVATPPNAIVFGSGLLTVGQMARAGIWLNVIATAVITLATWTLVRFVFLP